MYARMKFHKIYVSSKLEVQILLQDCWKTQVVNYFLQNVVIDIY